MVVLYGRAGRLTAENCGFRPGQYMVGKVRSARKGSSRFIGHRLRIIIG
jgi:hypothetical protein